MKTFNNRPNQQIWVSRSIAVLCVPIFYVKGIQQYYVPLGKRAPHLQEPNKWGLPVGYLDWNETVPECLIREVYEELGLYLPDCGEPIAGSIEHPYFVSSDPQGDARQNVTLRFFAAFAVQDYIDLPLLSKSPETIDVKWSMPEEAIGRDLAFNHSEILSEVRYMRKMPYS
jgi:8-oxo-dGTP diphosphatase